MGPSESQTRRELIDRQLLAAGWDASSYAVLAEHAVQLGRALDGEVAYQVGFTDYVLLDPDGRPLAVVEAKRSSRDPVAGQRQAAEYADALAPSRPAPFVYLANGRELWFWDRPGYPPRRVSGFHSPQDLVRLRFLRDHRKPLDGYSVNARIAGGPSRPYQREAVRHATERLSAGWRKLLFVMATGTGKTRTAIALVDLLLRAGWVQRVLFLADPTSTTLRPKASISRCRVTQTT